MKIMFPTYEKPDSPNDIDMESGQIPKPSAADLERGYVKLDFAKPATQDSYSAYSECQDEAAEVSELGAFVPRSNYSERL